MLSTASRIAPVLERRLMGLLPAGAVVRASRIGGLSRSPDDQCQSGALRIQEFAAGRRLAAEALAAVNAPSLVVPKGRRGMPVWPAGYTGSITHSDGFCLAALASTLHVRSIGIDLERLDAVKSDLADLICHPKELALMGHVPLGRFFSAKEALFKCQYPLTGEEAEFTDARLMFNDDGGFSVAVDDSRLELASRCVGRVAVIGPYVLAAAWLV